jgi:hypothetical protein
MFVGTASNHNWKAANNLLMDWILTGHHLMGFYEQNSFWEYDTKALI